MLPVLYLEGEKKFFNDFNVTTIKMNNIPNLFTKEIFMEIQKKYYFYFFFIYRIMATLGTCME